MMTQIHDFGDLTIWCEMQAIAIVPHEVIYAIDPIRIGKEE